MCFGVFTYFFLLFFLSYLTKIKLGIFSVSKMLVYGIVFE